MCPAQVLYTYEGMEESLLLSLKVYDDAVSALISDFQPFVLCFCVFLDRNTNQ